MFLPKDYVYANGYYGAVINNVIEQDRVLTTIRYFQNSSGDVIKLDSQQADNLLKEQKPEYLFFSKNHDVLVHGIPLKDIEKSFSPKDAYFNIMSLPVRDNKQQQAIAVLDLLKKHSIDMKYVGITGSLLIDFQTDSSDIDLVVYGRENFRTVRQFIKNRLGSNEIMTLSEEDWLHAYSRRDCEIDFETYLFHELRKYNKFIYDGTKVDISLVLTDDEIVNEHGPFRKMGHTIIKAKIVDDSKSYDLPARYYIDNSSIPEIVCYTATYIGQALQGESVEVSGYVEIDSLGHKRLLVGTSREAGNEYIKVINE